MLLPILTAFDSENMHTDVVSVRMDVVNAGMDVVSTRTVRMVAVIARTDVHNHLRTFITHVRMFITHVRML